MCCSEEQIVDTLKEFGLHRIDFVYLTVAFVFLSSILTHQHGRKTWILKP